MPTRARTHSLKDTLFTLSFTHILTVLRSTKYSGRSVPKLKPKKHGRKPKKYQRPHMYMYFLFFCYRFFLISGHGQMAYMGPCVCVCVFVCVCVCTLPSLCVHQVCFHFRTWPEWHTRGVCVSLSLFIMSIPSGVATVSMLD